MADYIDRQAAIELAKELYFKIDGSDYKTRQIDPSEIKELPSADVVEVVRCKDCKWHRGQWQCLNTDTYGFALDDYCSLAERREDG